MENALRAIHIEVRQKSESEVLILVLMENALRVSGQLQSKFLIMGLNPCFNGKCSQRAENKSNYLSVT